MKKTLALLICILSLLAIAGSDAVSTAVQPDSGETISKTAKPDSPKVLPSTASSRQTVAAPAGELPSAPESARNTAKTAEAKLHPEPEHSAAQTEGTPLETKRAGPEQSPAKDSAQTTASLNKTGIQMNFFSDVSSISTVLMTFAVLVLICACSTKLSSKINMPVLVVFLAIGMLAGPKGFAEVPFGDPGLANVIGTIAMAFILFSGGFDTKWSSIKNVVTTGGILSSLGVFLTAFFLGIIAFYFFRWQLPDKNLTFLWCLLLGAIISSTDAAAVFSILRSKSVSLKGDLQSLLEFESGSNDPMAAFLTITLVPLALHSMETPGGADLDIGIFKDIFLSFIAKMTLGVILGIAWGKIAVWLFNKINLDYDGLYYVLGIAVTLFSFGFTERFGGNGFMAVYVTGLVMGNSKFIYHNGLGRFHDGMAWLMQVILFTMLGLLADPKLLLQNWWIGLCIAAALMLVARPFSVLLCMLRSKFNWNERVLVSWVGLRGGAPVMLATFPLIHKLPGCEMMFHIVFFIVLTSVILQGMTIMPAAKKLKLDLPLKVHPRVPLEFENTGNMEDEMREYEILPNADNIVGKNLKTLGLPAGALVLLIRRGEKYVVPHGETKLEPNDSLMILGKPEVLDKTGNFLGVATES